MDPSASAPHRLQIGRLLGAGVGLLLGYGLASRLPLVPSTVLSALVIAAGISISAQLRRVAHWWGLIGTAAGVLLGNALVLAAVLQQRSPAEQSGERLALVLLLALAGSIAGRSIGRPGVFPPGRRPRDLLRSASAFTTGVFASLITLVYVHSGLEAARTASSRLSTALTILVVVVAVPGWISHGFGGTPPQPPAPAGRRPADQARSSGPPPPIAEER